MTSRSRTYAAPKVPEVFLVFWILKLLTTGIGETAADFLGTWSIPVAGVVGIGGFFAALIWQVRASTYHPTRYWITVLFVGIFGTMIADGPHVALGTPYYVDSAIYVVLLCALLYWWKRSEGTLDIHSIITPRRERFYWGTVLMTFGLGTALGDTTAQNLHMGYGWSVVLFGALILVPLAAWRMGASAVISFWVSYSMTRPLGASIADGLAVKSDATPPGLGLTTGLVTLVGLMLFAVLVVYVTVTHSDAEGTHAHRERQHDLEDPAPEHDPNGPGPHPGPGSAGGPAEPQLRPTPHS